MARLLVLTLLFFPRNSPGEYRAFELLITNSEAGTERRVASTLDDLQYPTYYPLYPGEQIKIEKTWRCPGNTSGQPTCSPPTE